MVFGIRRRHEAEIVEFEVAETASEREILRSLGVASLTQFEKMHRLDPNMPIDELEQIDAAIREGNAEKGVEIEHLIVEDNSPYPEVRSTVRNYDVDLPANTIRAWVIGMILCTIGSGVNMLFALRNPSVIVTTYAIQLVAYPIGLAWDLIFPDRTFRVLGLSFNLRPGKFNFKEHVIITVMSNAAYGGGSLYATDVIIVQQIWYKQFFGWTWQILFGITTLCTGYGLAGLSRRFLNCALFYTLHDHSKSDPESACGWRIGRYKWFLIVFCSAFVWYWFPGWIFQGLSYFCWVTWIAPENVIVNQLFGGVSGYGLLPISLDWTIISGYLGSPLIPPFYAIANTMVGLIVFFIIISMGLHYSGHWYAAYLPISSAQSFDNTGHIYNVSAILNENFHFDAEKYFSYSPLYLPTQFALAYGLAFATVSAIVVHVILYHGRTIKAQFTLARNQEDDSHMRMMKKYRDAEDWWYMALFAFMVALSFVVVCGWPTDFPWWALIVCLLIPIVFTIPIGIVQAITNIQLGLNVLTEYVVGYMLEGRPLAMMMFKNYGYLCMAQALFFASDMKLGHYMKVPPRTMFFAQLIASVWSAVIQIAVMNWALVNIPDVCTDNQEHQYTCANAKVFYTASIIWGVIGPRRMFSAGALYSSLQWFWLLGAIVPILTWLMARRYPMSLWRYVHVPLIFGGAGYLPPATVYIYLCVHNPVP
ncbi:putative small oligopeptide transporter [Diaporthe ampelina]|uniref:Putative small oligopeptide transporter n=1 Tax=Diaporthe ampelina TaxID=1214573 RepID=A0A0G2ID57_9PEZI|nr:putative small oligopeptide transporter [Diaporthe ampelina]